MENHPIDEIITTESDQFSIDFQKLLDQHVDLISARIFDRFTLGDINEYLSGSASSSNEIKSDIIIKLKLRIAEKLIEDLIRELS